MARFSIAVDPRAFPAFVDGAKANIAQAAKGAVTDAGVIALGALRADIAAAGLSSKFVAATRLDVFPKNRDTISAAAVLRNKIPWSGIVAEGGSIAGAPLLWLPIENNLPAAGGLRWTPESYAAAAGPLVSMAGAKPLLGVRRGGVTVPVFVGVPSVTIRPHLHVQAIVARAAAQLSALFTKRLKA